MIPIRSGWKPQWYLCKVTIADVWLTQSLYWYAIITAYIAEFLTLADREKEDNDTSQEKGVGTGATPCTMGGSDICTMLLEDLIIQLMNINAKLTHLFYWRRRKQKHRRSKWWKGMEKCIPSIQQKFILFASAANKNSVPGEPCMECKNLLEAPKMQVQSLLKFSISKMNRT